LIDSVYDSDQGLQDSLIHQLKDLFQNNNKNHPNWAHCAVSAVSRATESLYS